MEYYNDYVKYRDPFYDSYYDMLYKREWLDAYIKGDEIDHYKIYDKYKDKYFICMSDYYNEYKLFNYSMKCFEIDKLIYRDICTLLEKHSLIQEFKQMYNYYDEIKTNRDVLYWIFDRVIYNDEHL